MKKFTSLALAIGLLSLYSSLFAAGRFAPAPKLKLTTSKQVTTSYTFYTEIHDDGPDGKGYGNHNYSIGFYVTDSNTPGSGNAITLPVSLTVNANISISNDNGSGGSINQSITIGNGYQYFVDHEDLGANLSITINSANSNPTTINGKPLYISNQVIYNNY